MCGISGVFHHQSGAPADPAALRRMADAMAHRGPDDAGFHTDGALGLAFRRLSIIDLGGGHQPILSEDGRRAIIFNGEIYNYQEVKAELEAKGRRFLTKSDTEVILAAYEAWGPDGVEKLRGMFAYAIWDRDADRLVLARDRLGVKPLHYAEDGERILFASEIKSILAHGGVSKEVEPEAVADYFALRYVPAPKTIYRAVRKLPPGHLMVVERGQRPVIRQYWDVRFTPDDSRSEAAWIEELRSLLDESVRIRLMSEVPLGAFLSGGVDSSAVVATMAKFSTTPVSTHTIAFDEAAFDESAAAAELALHAGTSHHVETIRPDALEVLKRLAWHFDEPFADASAVPTYYVSKMARKHVTVALSGDGGDENFAGYARRYSFERAENRARAWLPRALRRTLFGALGAAYPKADWLPRVFRAKTTLTNLSLDPHEGFFNSMALSGHGRTVSPFLHPDFRKSLGAYRPSDLFRTLMEASGTRDPVSRAQYVDIKSFLVDDVLVKVDRASMAVSLEAREPLLDHRLMECAARMPSSLKLVGREGKVIFKKAISDRVPPDLLRRKKQGFELPISGWFRREIREFSEALLFRSHPVTDAFVDRAYVRSLYDAHLAGTRDATHHLYTALMFELWADAHG